MQSLLDEFPIITERALNCVSIPMDAISKIKKSSKNEILTIVHLEGICDDRSITLTSICDPMTIYPEFDEILKKIHTNIEDVDIFSNTLKNVLRRETTIFVRGNRKVVNYDLDLAIYIDLYYVGNYRGLISKIINFIENSYMYPIDF